MLVVKVILIVTFNFLAMVTCFCQAKQNDRINFSDFVKVQGLVVQINQLLINDLLNYYIPDSTNDKGKQVIVTNLTILFNKAQNQIKLETDSLIIERDKKNILKTSPTEFKWVDGESFDNTKISVSFQAILYTKNNAKAILKKKCYTCSYVCLKGLIHEKEVLIPCGN